MTNQEAITELKDLKDYCHSTFMKRTCEVYTQAIDKGIKSLEKQKTGHWVNIPKHSLDGEHPSYDVIKCSECETHWEYKFSYCPNCGAKMGGE